MSAIDVTLPVTGVPTTASVRSNFQIAHDEITALQAETAALQAATAGGPFLPIAGGEVRGALQVDGPLRVGVTVDAGYKLDVAGGGGVRFRTDGGTASWAIITANALSTLPAPPSNTMLHIAGIDGGNPRLLLDSYSTFGGNFTYRSVGIGGTAAAPVAMAANQNMGVTGYIGHDGTLYSQNAATFLAAADALWSATSHPTRFTWSTTPTGSITIAERMRLTNAGNLLIGSTADNGVDRLQVTGSARVSGGIGAFGHTAPAAQPTFTGAKGGNTALASVIAVLVAAGFALDTTTA